jgi:hypothetical protein
MSGLLFDVYMSRTFTTHILYSYPWCLENVQQKLWHIRPLS